MAEEADRLTDKHDKIRRLSRISHKLI